MSKTPLNEYMTARRLSQSDMASLVGLTQGAISKMLLRGRNVFVVQDKNSISLVEDRVVATNELPVSQASAG